MKNAPSSFKKLVLKAEKDEYFNNYLNIMNSMKPKELDLLLTYTIYDKVDSQFSQSENHKFSQANFVELMKRKAKINDFKSPLWIVLPLKEKVMM